jgi:hypothetical protein
VTQYEFYLVTPFNCMACLHAADRGNETARQTLLAMSKVLKVITKDRRKTLCMCLDCNVEFSKKVLPVAFTISIPMFPFADKNSKRLVVNCICERCLHRDNLEAEILRTLRELWPDASFQQLTMMQ